MDFYRDILLPNSDKFDFSKYPKDHFLHSNKNKKILGKFSDETPGRFEEEYVALCPIWSEDAGGSDAVKKAKGVKKNVIKKCLKFEDYKRILDSRGTVSVQQHTLRSFNLQVYTIEQRKVGLSGTDDKR